MDNLRYSRDEWDSALEAAESLDWDPVDAEEQHSPLAQWLCDQVIDHDKVERDVARIEAALNVLTERGEGEVSPERLIDVLNSYQGETVDDWRTLAEEYADENGIELVFLNGTPTEDDYHKWYVGRGVWAGEVCAGTSVGGSLYWFDSSKW
ncbi:hypothetical protein [Streptomyces cucumeris]|uniref:hypothetical protein n=1 Tax=Streptomyces cucumeris TaxID=2962890 RepID=UPI0020C88738|nr:hypothetical protein [Streptomyces sp. NEAU-Y11]MCP9209560.1 hypothetical protein [Streptomyces sp. NEAU-Y11]